jgi:hypothetical protein
VAPKASAGQNRRHTGVPLDSLSVERLARTGPDLDFRDEVGEGRLDHGMLAERRENLGDVTQERPVGPDHEHVGPGHGVVPVQEKGGPVKPDGCLA